MNHPQMILVDILHFLAMAPLNLHSESDPMAPTSSYYGGYINQRLLR